MFWISSRNFGAAKYFDFFLAILFETAYICNVISEGILAFVCICSHGLKPAEKVVCVRGIVDAVLLFLCTDDRTLG